MKIALLGHGKEGQAIETYFKSHYTDLECDIFENFTYADLQQRDYSSYDIIFRSPSVPPLHLPNESSVTKYFFEHCPCPIIGVTGTKGKGTTCSFIKALLDASGADAYLVGNIGVPAINVLDNLKSTSVVVYEMSSFQLWDLHQSPHIAVIGTIEPDHLNVHRDFSDYLDAKTNICRHQSAQDFCIFYQNNPDSTKIASSSKAQKIPYPFEVPTLIQNAIRLPGQHNQNNAIAAIAAVASYKNISPSEYLSEYQSEIIHGLQAFKGLPHRLEFLRNFEGIDYYDDNFSTNPSSTRVAINAFPNHNLIVIIGGRDKTNNADLPEIYDILRAQQIKHIVLIGESGHELAKRHKDPRFIVKESLKAAVESAHQAAKELASSSNGTAVIMSPAAASFDMFQNVYDRGDQFQQLVNNL